MSVAPPRHRHSFRDYLEVEEMSAVKHEYLAGEIYAMAGGTPEHAALCAGLIVVIGSRLSRGPCRAYTSDLRVRVTATGLATYPDTTVIGGELVRDPASPTHVTNPTVLFEVLSPGTEDHDRGEKREHYQQIGSLRDYVVIAQDRRHVEHWRRDDHGSWSHAMFSTGQELVLDAIGCRVTVDEIYDAAGIP